MKHYIIKTTETNKETTDMETEEITMNENVEVSGKDGTRRKLADKEETNNRDSGNKNTDSSTIIQNYTEKLEQLYISIINNKNINNAKRIARLERLKNIKETTPEILNHEVVEKARKIEKHVRIILKSLKWMTL